jgi:hypothetical protein
MQASVLRFAVNRKQENNYNFVVSENEYLFVEYEPYKVCL